MNPSNGNNGNGYHGNGNGNGNGKGRGTVTATAPQKVANEPQFTDYKADFEQSVVLRQSPVWSQAIVWTIMGVTAFGIGWAALAKMEQVVPAQGQLKPIAKVQEVQIPVNGVVKEVFVKDGDRVQKNQLLLVLDSTASQAELQSLKNIRQSLVLENQFYRAVMTSPLSMAQIEAEMVRLKLPKEVALLARNRVALTGENQLYRAQLGMAPGTNLDQEQAARLQVGQAELSSRAAAARLEVAQLYKQLSQNQVQLAEAQQQVIIDKKVLEDISQRNIRSVDQAVESLEIEKGILKDIEPLITEGALARVQYERQKQEVNDRAATLLEQMSSGTIDYDKQKQQLTNRQAEIAQLKEEQQRLQFNIAKAKQELTITKATSANDVFEKIANNQKRIAEIDSQLTKIIVDNEKQIADTNSKISSAEVTIKYQELRAPTGGTIFDLQARPGFVPKPSQAEPLLKIVPDDSLIAEVFITNKDIGFVLDAMKEKAVKADIRIDSFPFSEFGDIKGEVTEIGSDALPPDEIHKFYRFPAKVKLDQQYLDLKGRNINLQSGMSISVNIKVRENRTVLSLFTELFSKKIDTMKQVR